MPVKQAAILSDILLLLFVMLCFIHRVAPYRPILKFGLYGDKFLFLIVLNFSYNKPGIL